MWEVEKNLEILSSSHPLFKNEITEAQKVNQFAQYNRTSHKQMPIYFEKEWNAFYSQAQKLGLDYHRMKII